MTRDEQHKMIIALKDFTKKMKRDEQYAFEMMCKRDKDDEDLDTINRKKLEELHARFFPKKTKKDLEDLWKKFSNDATKEKDTP